MIFPAALNLLFFAAVLDSIVTIFSGNLCGLLGNKAADASFIACMLPMVFRMGLWRNWVLSCACVMIWAIVFTGSSTGLAGIGIGLSAVAFQDQGKKSIFLIAPLSFLVVGFGLWHLGSYELLDFSGRQIMWKEAYGAVLDRRAYLWGLGTGSFTNIGVAIQRLNHPKVIWEWLHNEYLEVFFENGFVGLGIVCVLCVVLFKRLYAKRDIGFAVLAVYAFTAITEMPVRLFVTQILGVCLVWRAFETKSD